ncbi:MAG TPA: phosphate ABC transporter substrate-binding protein [Usitatibacter sp.]|jgi:ABC-type phosphate transport system substrate-binding protein|nr:phosphate ABC transporter substrate-binding protein [Usitatibacter sp.]
MTKRLLFQLLAAFVASVSLAAGAEDVVAVVSAKSPITSLNSEQVADIFLGKTTRFPDGSAAVPIDQNEDSPDRDRFYAQYTGKSPAQVKAHWSKLIFTGRGQPPRQVANAAEAKRVLAQDPHAIAYIDNRLVDSSVRVLSGQ